MYTDDWPPYVRTTGADPGIAARVVRLVLDDMGREAEFQYYGYAYGYHLMKTGAPGLSFPYFETQARKGEVLFSAPLFQVRTLIFYNRRFHSLATCDESLSTLQFGRVAGYSYGEEFDSLMRNEEVFSAEAEAIEALLNGQIDALPMTASVASAFLDEQFPDRRQLVRAIDDCSTDSQLHVVAPNTESGRALLEAFNASHARLSEEGVLAYTDETTFTGFAQREDIVELVAAEGFPVIVGRDAGANDYFALPQGTRATVKQWSRRISEGSKTDRLYQTMVDESVVVILNGPHVGKELRVKNMHINIVE
ncbi:substrate-binding periplasmic protein [Hyphococcus sp.]|uniref:substrate-binding periplasmic protein n=1 Tax=Hyphococcus sp. TaxID=2038636 RepID=UPI003CCBF4E6